MPETAPRPAEMCGASTGAIRLGDEPPHHIGPCVLRKDHDGPVHQAQDGTQWAGDVGRAPEAAPRPDVPDEAVAAFCHAFWGASPAELAPGLVEQARTTLAAVLPAHKRQVREQALRDLDAGRIAAEDLAAAGLQVGHVVDLRDDGWTVQHPLTCGADLFGCPVNRAAERDLTGPPHEFGRFKCGVEGGEFWIGEVR